MSQLKDRLLKAGIESSLLDELVHEVASNQASEVNNGGMDSQVAYLLQSGWSEQDILSQLGVG